MDKVQMNEIAEKLIEQAKEMSKEKFLNFAEKMYGVDRSTWDHLWSVPIVPTYDDESIFPAELSSISRDDILDILDGYVEDSIGKSEAVFISSDDMILELPDEAIEEYKQGVENGSITEGYNAVIVYNESVLKRQFMEHVEAGEGRNPPMSQEEINKKFLDLTAETFTHERMHLNANVLVTDIEDPSEMIEVNGAEKRLNFNYREYNEVLLDTVAKMIHVFQEGDTIEDCLYKVIQERGGKSAYSELDDRLVLSLFTMFPEELSKWVMFEAYEEQHENIIEQKYLEVFGGNAVFRKDEMLKRVGDYFNKTASKNMTKEQFSRRKEMLEMIGVRNIQAQQSKTIGYDQFKNLATSEQAMEQLPESFSEMKTVYKELTNPKQQESEVK